VFRIRELVISERQEEHIWVKHQVSIEEVDQACESAHLVLRGRDGSYAIYGQTAAGRYLVLFIYPRGDDVYSLATARDLTDSERRRIRNLTPVDLYDDEEA
jgi:uncharacterized DUF497 family protein